MWKCPICLRENREPVCPNCGFDGSCDYEHYPTADRLTTAPESIARRRRRYQGSLNIQSCPACGCKQFFLKDMLPVCAQCGYVLAPVQQKQGIEYTVTPVRFLTEKLNTMCGRLFRGKKYNLAGVKPIGKIAGLVLCGLLIAAVGSFVFGEKNTEVEPPIVSNGAEDVSVVVDDCVNVSLVNTVEDSTHTYHVSTLGLFERWSGEEALDLYSQSGEKGELTGSYEEAIPLGQGFVQLKLKSEGKNADTRYALADCGGRILIPGVSSFEWVTGQKRTDSGILWEDKDNSQYQETARYLLVRTAEGRQFYDTRSSAIIEDFVITDDSASFASCGDSLVVLYEDGTAELYDEKGSLLASFDRHPEVGDVYLLVNYSSYERELCKLYDQSGRLIREIERDLTLIEGTGGYLTDAGYGSHGIYDSTGREVLPEKYDNVLWEYQGIFLVRTREKDDYKYGLIRTDGTWAVSNAYDRVGHIWKDYFYASVDHSYDLICSRGIITEGVGLTEDLVCRDYYSKKLLILNEGRYSLPCSEAKALTYGLAACKMEEEDGYRIVDAFRGEVLTELVYEEVLYSNGYVFGYSGGYWYVYRVSYPDGETQTEQKSVEIA